MEHEITMANMLARNLRVRVAVVQCGSVIVCIDAAQVEAHEIVLYMTI